MCPGLTTSLHAIQLCPVGSGCYLGSLVSLLRLSFLTLYSRDISHQASNAKHPWSSLTQKIKLTVVLKIALKGPDFCETVLFQRSFIH